MLIGLLSLAQAIDVGRDLPGATVGRGSSIVPVIRQTEAAPEQLQRRERSDLCGPRKFMQILCT